MTEPKTFKIEIGLDRGTEVGWVTQDWTGAFTKDGKVIDGTAFKLDDIYLRVAHATIIGDYPPSATVRLFPPGYYAVTRSRLRQLRLQTKDPSQQQPSCSAPESPGEPID